MIINVPIYLEVDAKFSPQDGREFTLKLRKLIRDSISESNGGKFRVKDDDGRSYTIKILSENQAIARFGSPLRQDKPQPPKEE
jgi:hypothetical protein